MAQSIKLPSQLVLRELFDYNDGKLVWRVQMGRGRIGESAGCVTGYYKKKSRVQIRIFGTLYLAHRLIYKWHYGDFDETKEIDHINGDANDNRIENLRAVDHQTNMQNTRKRSDNTSGVPGIVWDKSKNKWMVRLGSKFIGRSSNFDDAIAIRKRALFEKAYHPNHGT